MDTIVSTGSLPKTKVWFTPEEASRFLGHSKKFVQRKTSSGKLKAHLLVGTRLWRYHREELEEFRKKMKRR